jgi:predicted RNA-binding Zn-ribbon protein involved in translation (DUF1610 family)
MTLLEFQQQFATESQCEAYLVQQRWPDGFRCPRCGHDQAYPIHRTGQRRNAGERLPLYQCRQCGHPVSVTAGTVFHKTQWPLPYGC